MYWVGIVRSAARLVSQSLVLQGISSPKSIMKSVLLLTLQCLQITHLSAAADIDQILHGGSASNGTSKYGSLHPPEPQKALPAKAQG